MPLFPEKVIFKPRSVKAFELNKPRAAASETDESRIEIAGLKPQRTSACADMSCPYISYTARELTTKLLGLKSPSGDKPRNASQNWTGWDISGVD